MELTADLDNVNSKGAVGAVESFSESIEVEETLLFQSLVVSNPKKDVEALWKLEFISRF